MADNNSSDCCWYTLVHSDYDNDYSWAWDYNDCLTGNHCSWAGFECCRSFDRRRSTRTDCRRSWSSLRRGRCCWSCARRWRWRSSRGRPGTGSPASPGCGHCCHTAPPGSSGSAPSPRGHTPRCIRPTRSSCSKPWPRGRGRRSRGRSNRPCRGRRGRTSCSCLSRTRGPGRSPRGRRASRRLPGRHSRPPRTDTGLLECSTAARRSCDPCISDLK